MISGCVVTSRIDWWRGATLCDLTHSRLDLIQSLVWKLIVAWEHNLLNPYSSSSSIMINWTILSSNEYIWYRHLINRHNVLHLLMRTYLWVRGITEHSIFIILELQSGYTTRMLGATQGRILILLHSLPISRRLVLHRVIHRLGLRLGNHSCRGLLMLIKLVDIICRLLRWLSHTAQQVPLLPSIIDIHTLQLFWA